MTRSVSPARFAWVAGADGVAHATWRHSGNRSITACRTPALDPRWAHPERSRCRVCLEALGLLWLDEPEDAA